MAGLRCSDCIFCSCFRDKKTGLVQALCSRGYTLANPLCEHEPDMYFARDMRAFVPVVDPFGEMYLRTRNTCAQFEKRNTPLDERCLGENNERGNSRAGNALGDVGAGASVARAGGGAESAVAGAVVTVPGSAGTDAAGGACVAEVARAGGAAGASVGAEGAGAAVADAAGSAEVADAAHTTQTGVAPACKRGWLARFFSHRE